MDDHLTIDCNDYGATFTEAQVACDLSFVLEELLENEVLQQLLPCNPLQHSPSSSDQVILAIPVNYFACGGMAIGVCISHVIADASAGAHFLKSWAKVACGAENIEGVICDCSSIFSPRDLSIFYKVMNLVEENNSVESSTEDDIITKRFLFDGSNIVALRNEMEDGLNLFRPTRVEAITALLWEALIIATAENDRISLTLEASIAVDMRKRMNPSLPQQCIGSICFVTNARTHHDKLENRKSLSRKIHESINEIDDEYIRKRYTIGEGFNKFMEKACEEYEKNPKLGVFYFTSWCKFPFYETDFEFGKPKWVEGALRGNRIACFLDTSDGEGIEACITLSRDEMAILERQNGILAFATFKPSI